MMHTDLERSAAFLLRNAGPVIRYRLRREILGDLDAASEASLLAEICELPLFRRLLTYVKPDGYIGSGMHSWDNWRGTVLHETPLQDGECAARLLSYYRIPKTHPVVRNFVAAMRDEEILRAEFSYIPPEIPRFENRFAGIRSGNCLMALLYTMQAMLGYGDDYEDLRDFQQIALRGFAALRGLNSLADITCFDPHAKRRYNCPYIDENVYLPNAYTLEMLAYTRAWRSDANRRLLAEAINRMDEMPEDGNRIQIRIRGKYMAPGWALVRPFRPFRADCIDTIMYRRPLTELAMLGLGGAADVLRVSAENSREAMDADGILRLDFRRLRNKRYSPKSIEYPGAYVDVRLEADYADETALLCDLTFWAVEFLHLYENGKGTETDGKELG